MGAGVSTRAQDRGVVVSDQLSGSVFFCTDVQSNWIALKDLRICLLPRVPSVIFKAAEQRE